MKATLFGVGLSVFGTFFYVLVTTILIYRRMKPLGIQGQIGYDVVSPMRSALHNPYCWLLAAGLLATGYAIAAMWPRPVV